MLNERKMISCYVRVSTNKEDQQKSLQQQRELLQEMYKDYEILMYSDTGTGTSFNRKGFKKLLYDAGLNEKRLKDGRLTFEADEFREPLFNEIVVLSTSRFARNIIIIDVLRTLWDFKKVNVKFLDVQKDSSNMNDMILLQMFFAMAENEVKETSVRTKRGNKTTIMQNKIRNNSIFGWDFDRESNSLIANEEESRVVRFIFNTALKYGLKRTAQLTNEAGYRTKKGNLWTDSTIKTLITNPKYKGYNVRNKFTSENLFTESKVKYVKKENWIIMKNDRIEPLVSEELWQDVQESLKNRCLHGNRGTNARKYDTRGKVVCKCCGATYVRCVEKRIIDKPQGHHYLICSHKKKYTKKYCQSENINVEILDDFIEEQRKVYYKNIHLQINLKIIKLKKELSKVNAETVDMVNDLIKIEEDKLRKNKTTLETLLNSFIDSTSSTMQDIIKKKIQALEKEIEANEIKISSLENKKVDKNKYIRELSNKISALKKEGKELPTKILERKEWLDKVEKIVVGGKNDLVVVYSLD
ncbi:Recombinase [Clostridium paraputrificum]|uniref:Recombinase n=1 Tax=Clostridium paraputrificum TaxID=29363 RepID=A0A6N3FFC9_9CLOT